jgi:hypothetical protein
VILRETVQSHSGKGIDAIIFDPSNGAHRDFSDAAVGHVFRHYCDVSMVNSAVAQAPQSGVDETDLRRRQGVGRQSGSLHEANSKQSIRLHPGRYAEQYVAGHTSGRRRPQALNPLPG